MRKVLAILWAADSAALVCLFGDIFLHGTNPDRQALASDLGAVWGALAVYWLFEFWKMRNQKYATLVFSLVCFGGVAATSVFILASATAQGSPSAFKQDGISVLGLIFTAVWAKHEWSKITAAEPESVPALHQKHRAFGWKAGTVVSAALVIAGVVGAYSGVRAGHQARLNTLTEQMSELGKKGAPAKLRFMELARKDTNNLPDYLERCAELEPAVNEYESVERQMNGLLNESLREMEVVNVGTRYDESISTVVTLRRIVSKDLESADVYKKEIALAKELPSIPLSNRVQFYTANIQPVVRQEASIANEEIEILRDAKEKGVSLPQSLYTQAGIN